MKNYVQKGDTVTAIAPADLASGDFTVVGSLFGVASGAAKAGAEVEIATGGVYDLPKTSAQAWTVGVALYWDAAASKVTTTVASNLKIGVAVLAAANPSTLGRVRLNPAF